METSRNDQSQLRQELIEGYSSGFRRIEIAGLFIFAAFFLYDGAHLARAWPLAMKTTTLLVLALATGWFMADLVSGLVHWACDTWGDVNVPILGQTLIRTFREHHVDAESITRHDFVEVNASNALGCIPFLIGIAWLKPTTHSFFSLWACTALFSFLFWIFMTNQVHFWSHSKKVSPLVRFLQKSRLILSARAHAVHHTPPFEHHYAITSGVTNAIFKKFGLYRKMEALIVKLTGAVPREDDRKYWQRTEKPAALERSA